MRTWRRILQRGISALDIVFLFTVRVSTCLCVSLQRAAEFCIHQSYMTCFSQSLVNQLMMEQGGSEVSGGDRMQV